MTAVVVSLGCVVTFATAVCGHHRLPWPVARMARSAWAAVAPRKPVAAPLAPEQPARDSSPPLAAARRTAVQPPAWARSEKDAA